MTNRLLQALTLWALCSCATAYGQTIPGSAKIPSIVPSVSLVSSANPSGRGNIVTFTASLTSTATPTGSVDFRNGANTMAGCGAVALANSSAVCATNALPLGTHQITAHYSGDQNHYPAQSTALAQSIENPPQLGSCALNSVSLSVFMPGGGTRVSNSSIAFSEPKVPGSSVVLGVYCEGSGQYPAPPVSGATYSWNTGATAHRIEVSAPAAGGSQRYEVFVTDGVTGKTLATILTGATPGSPVCSLSTSAPQPIEPGRPFEVRASCSPAASTYAWSARSFTGAISQLSGTSDPAATFVIQNSQPGEVIPIYLIASNAAGPAPFTSLLATAGYPSGQAASIPAGIAAGGTHSCALTAFGGAKCWGSNSSGQNGDYAGAVSSRTAPVNVIGGATDIAALTSGYLHSCALTSAGAVKCWGDDTYGQLGDGAAAISAFHAYVQGLPSGVTSIASSASSWHTCAVSAGAVSCWGRNDFGQLGANGGAGSSAPVSVPGLPSVARVATGAGHTCVLTSSGGVKCWGKNSEGQLGDATTTARSSPVDVVGISSGAVAVAAAHSHSCALMSSGRVKCWGWNGEGELGVGSMGGISAVPVDVAGLNDATSISVGGNHTCAISSAGGVKCWGRNSEGQLGDGTVSHRGSPTAVASLAGSIRSVGAGGFHTCAVTSGGAVMCWGMNTSGMLGDGTYVSRVRPVAAVSTNAGGNLDAADWFLDLDPTVTESLGVGVTPRVLVESRLAGSASVVSLDVNLKFRNSEVGKGVNLYVLAQVSPEFFNAVKRAPGAAEDAGRKAKAGLVLAQLTPNGWLALDGNLVAYTQAVVTTQGSLARILDRIPYTLPPGSRFCVGYGDSSAGMLSAGTLREVLAIEGTTPETSTAPCVLSGLYLDGLKSSQFGTPATFKALVVGVGPTGTVQFKDGPGNLLAPVDLVPEPDSFGVARAAVVTSSLATGPHSIAARYSGNGTNPPIEATEVVPLRHEVSAPTSGSSTTLEGPASSVLGREVSFSAAITGNNPGGSVQFRDGIANLGEAAPVVGALATIRISTLPVGTHSITVHYSGDSLNSASASNAVSHTVYAAINTQAAVSSSQNPSVAGAPVTFTALVSGTNPSGSVRFRDGSAALGIVALTNGSASITVSSLEAGEHLIIVDYLGDANNQVVSSAALAQQVTLPIPAAVALSVTKTGTGSGTVTSSPAGISCGSTCMAVFPSGSTVTLTAAASTSSIFVGWSGSGCSGTSTCQASPIAATTVSASFATTAGSPTAAAHPANLDFGGQSIRTTSGSQRVTLTNVGSGTLTVTGASVGNANFAQTNNCSSLVTGASCTATITFTPSVQGTQSDALIFQTSGGTLTVTLTGTGEKSLVTHYYRSILRRAPEQAGKAFWEAEAARMQGLQANVNETWYSMAMSFYFGAEYAIFNRNNSEFVTDLYNTFFNRAPDSEGFAFWTSQLASGMPREGVLANFMFSPEFALFTQAIFGNTAARSEINVVMDFYRGLLSRLPDTGGFNFYVQQFRTAQCQGAGASGAVYTQAENISSGYANSQEYSNRGRSTSQYVADLYNSFLRRGPDLLGLQFWVGQINGGRSRESVRQEFKVSPEFDLRVNAIIQQGCFQ